MRHIGSLRHIGSFLGRLLAVLAVATLSAFGASPRALAAEHGGNEGTTTLVALGDSLTAGFDLPSRAAFPAVLERELKERGHDVRVINAGVSGDTAAGGLARLDWSVPEEADGVILALGANDMLRGLDPEVTERALRETVERLEARDIGVLLVGMVAAPNMGEAYRARFDRIYPEIARDHDLLLYPFFLEGVIQEPDLMLPDGIHPGAQGVERMVENILPTVEAFLARIEGR